MKGQVKGRDRDMVILQICFHGDTKLRDSLAFIGFKQVHVSFLWYFLCLLYPPNTLGGER